MGRLICYFNELLAQRHTTKSVIILSLNLPKVTASQRIPCARKRIIKGFAQIAANYIKQNLKLEEIILHYGLPFHIKRELLLLREGIVYVQI